LSNYHSDKAADDNREYHKDLTKAAYQAILLSRGKGITSTELSTILKVPEHRTCASALSRAKKKYRSIVYRNYNGESMGRYYHSAFAPKGGE
jgi:DNA-directed RNA polymerase specialized sigma24 family protein